MSDSAPSFGMQLARRLDDFFLTEEMRRGTATELARLRMGLLLTLGATTAVLLLFPLQFAVWSEESRAWTATITLTLFSTPFLLRKSELLRHLGSILCGALTLIATWTLTQSGGQSLTLLPFFPLLPLFGLLTGGARVALQYMAIAMALCGYGWLLVNADYPAVARFVSARSPEHMYAVALLSILGVGVVAQIFDWFSDRTAVDVANRAQARLLEREEQSRLLLENSAEGVVVTDEQGTVRFASPAATHMLGLQKQDAVGRAVRDFTTTRQLEQFLPAWRRLLEEPGTAFELQIEQSPGEGPTPRSQRRFFEISASNQLENPSIQGITVRVRDVTALTLLRADYQSLLDHSIQGIAVECRGRFVYANDALASLFGYSRDEFMSNTEFHTWDLVHPEDTPGLQSQYASQESGTSELRYDTKSGWRWLRVKWASAHWDEHPARQISMVDITAERERDEIREQEKARLSEAVNERTRDLEASQTRLREQERMATVGTLAAGIAHQINNPIGSILTGADFALLTEGEENSEETTRAALEDIRSQAIRCGKIVRSVLQFSRAEPTEKWSSDLTSVLRTSVDVTKRFAKEREATVDLSLDPESTQRSTRMNPIELEQVFVNLIRNAIEAQPRGAKVQVRTRLAEGEAIEVVVADDGPGISSDDGAKIFDPFYTTRLRDGGTGLGLSVAHGIVQDHGGKMWLESPPRENEGPYPGAHFHILLPSETGHSSDDPSGSLG